MDINSVDTLLDWLKEKPRTLGWGAILAYGRSETNKVLLQEYITRFSTGDFMQPITEEVRDSTTPTQKNFLHNYQMDAPRLSFAGSNLQKSAAKLTMKEVGGTHLSFTKQEGAQQWSLTRVSEKDVLDGPGLKFDIDLTASAGSVTTAGRVELDISNGSNYRLIDMPSEHLQRVAGERFKNHFKGLPETQRVFVLNELRFEPDQFLKPSKFHIRTHNKKDSGVRLLADEDEGEGAVVVFVAMEGDENGYVPIDNADLKYLLPEGHSVTVLLACDMVKEKIMANGLRKVNQLPEFEYDDIIRNDVFYGIRGMKGGIKEPWGMVSNSRFDIEIPNLEIKFYNVYEDFPSYFSFVTPGYPSWLEEGAEIKYCGLAVVGVQVQPNVVLRKYKGVEYNVPAQILLVYGGGLSFELLIKNGNLVFERRTEMVGAHRYVASSNELSQYLTAEDWDLLGEIYQDKLVATLEPAYERFISTLPILNVFTLNSLLFRGGNSISLQSAHTPTDWALFGHVGPNQSAFSITELEPIIPHTVPLQFRTEPLRNDLTWSVRNILGENVPKGVITSSGLYTPPTAAEIQRSSVRVVITATDGTHTSSALVSVTKRSLSVNPLIMIATAGDSLGHDVSAGAVDGGRLDWSIQDPASGAEIRPNPAEGKDHSYVPGPAIGDSSPTVDTIVVTNPRTRVSETTSVLVLHRRALLQVVINEAVTLPENQLQLSIMGVNGPINPGAWNEEWQVLLGGGSARIDAVTGVLTLDPAGPDKFVVITVLAPPPRPEMASDDGYIILPLPLFTVPETIRMLRAEG
ncbi:hypothetical protein BK652_04955 [Pseudomonas brassicacearum]|uniref:Uncharacterized protein n=1 Tax=Pseudomonas brassicacearum TaxID=930166 RepID=A0A423GFG0_9PSED|nr:hypothetical protein [Pseudomonas brassicacearum]ROM85928.1 hypothetical protein BK652_04955 [Pseudomonas brassicacearum]